MARQHSTVNDGSAMAAYERFCALMTEKELYKDESVSYRSVCDSLGVSQDELDDVLMSEMGMSGRQVMDAFRKGTFLKKP